MNVLFEGNTTKGKDEWLTPPHVIKACGEFDLDPCSPIVRPWATAKNHFTIVDNGLRKEWFGRVWCNPPYGELAGQFLKKCARHGNAIGLVFTRCETEWFYKSVWDKADALRFIKGRLNFFEQTCLHCGLGRSKHTESFEKEKHSFVESGNFIKGGSAGCGSVLVAYGQDNVEVLQKCSIAGKFIKL